MQHAGTRPEPMGMCFLEGHALHKPKNFLEPIWGDINKNGLV